MVVFLTEIFDFDKVQATWLLNQFQNFLLKNLTLISDILLLLCLINYSIYSWLNKVSFIINLSIILIIQVKNWIFI